MPSQCKLCVCIYGCVCVRVHVRVCVCVRACVCVCVCVCMCVHACIYVCIKAQANINFSILLFALLGLNKLFKYSFDYQKQLK